MGPLRQRSVSTLCMLVSNNNLISIKVLVATVAYFRRNFYISALWKTRLYRHALTWANWAVSQNCLSLLLDWANFRFEPLCFDSCLNFNFPLLFKWVEETLVQPPKEILLTNCLLLRRPKKLKKLLTTLAMASRTKRIVRISHPATNQNKILFKLRMKKYFH